MKKLFILILLLITSGCSLTSKNSIPKLQYNTSSTTDAIKNEQVIDKNSESNEQNIEKTETTTVKQQETIEPEIQKTPHEVTKLIVNGETYTDIFIENTSVYKFMQNLSVISTKYFHFETKEYAGIGKFVQSINGLKEETRNKMYWIYYINGQTAQIGITDYIIQQGDVIEWKYEKSKF